MTDRHILWLLLPPSLTAALASTVFVTVPVARQQATTQQAYIVCYQFNGAPAVDYYSDPFPDAGNFSKFTTDFENYVDATYHVGKRLPSCIYYKTEAEALAALNQRVAIAKNKVVETHWKSADPAVPTVVQSPSMPARPPVQDKSPYNPNASTLPPYAFCWAGDADYTMYFTPVLNLDNVDPQTLNRDFHAFVQKTYGANVSTACPVSRGQAAAERTRQDQIDEIKRTTPKTRTPKFVDVNWKPAPATTTAAPAAGGVPAPPPSNTLDAYQRALAAQRPNGVAASMQMFCYATGAPPVVRGNAQVHTYVTKVFSGSATAQMGTAFQTFLRNAHHDENIGPGTCSTAPDADTLQGTRAEYVASQRKMPNRTVVEVDWKGGQ